MVLYFLFLPLGSDVGKENRVTSQTEPGIVCLHTSCAVLSHKMPPLPCMFKYMAHPLSCNSEQALSHIRHPVTSFVIFENKPTLFESVKIPIKTRKRIYSWLEDMKKAFSLVCIQRHGAFSKAWKQGLFSPQLKVSRNESYHHLECLYIQ